MSVRQRERRERRSGFQILGDGAAPGEIYSSVHARNERQSSGETPKLSCAHACVSCSRDTLHGGPPLRILLHLGHARFFHPFTFGVDFCIRRFTGGEMKVFPAAGASRLWILKIFVVTHTQNQLISEPTSCDPS